MVSFFMQHPLLENGEECMTGSGVGNEILPRIAANIKKRGATVIEDHTIVACGGIKESGTGKFTLRLLNN